ncbi:MAG: hypothetical protein ACRDTK_09930 [Mycobacterium sp.]
MADPSGAFPQIPQELALQVKTQIESLMEHAQIAANQGHAAVEEVVMSGAHSGGAAFASNAKAGQINADLVQVIHGCVNLAHKLGVSVAQFAQHDADATSQVQSISSL